MKFNVRWMIHANLLSAAICLPRSFTVFTTFSEVAWNSIELKLWWQDLEHKLTFAQQAGRSGQELVDVLFIRLVFVYSFEDVWPFLRHLFLICQVVLRMPESKNWQKHHTSYVYYRYINNICILCIISLERISTYQYRPHFFTRICVELQARCGGVQVVDASAPRSAGCPA